MVDLFAVFSAQNSKLESSWHENCAAHRTQHPHTHTHTHNSAQTTKIRAVGTHVKLVCNVPPQQLGVADPQYNLCKKAHAVSCLAVYM